MGNLYLTDFEAAIKDSHAKKNYLKYEEKLDKIDDDNFLKERLEYLKTKNTYLKNCTGSFKREANVPRSPRSSL